MYEITPTGLETALNNGREMEMRADELKVILRRMGLNWGGVMICLIVKAISKSGMGSYQAENLLVKLTYMRVSAIRILRMIREISRKSAERKENDCIVCEGSHKIRVFNFTAEFPKGFEKRSLLTVPLKAYSVEIDCPRCGDKSVWERYNEKLKSRSELEQEIAKVYLLRYQEKLEY